MSYTARSLRIPLVLLLGLLILAACAGGGEDPSPTAEPVVETPTETDETAATIEPTVDNPFPTIEATLTVTPQPTVESIPPDPAGATVEAPILGGVGTPVFVTTGVAITSSNFDKITLLRTGGPARERPDAFEELIIIESNGRMTRNGAEGRISESGIRTLNDLLEASQFFALQAGFISAVPDSETFLYQIVVQQGGVERMISAHDGLMPQILKDVISAVLQEGFKIPRP